MIELGDKLQQLRGFRDFSGFLEQLIREEWERRNGPIAFGEMRSREAAEPQRTERSKKQGDPPVKRKPAKSPAQ